MMGFKQTENHAHMVAFYTIRHNLVRQYETLWVMPAMAAGLSHRQLDTVDVAALIDIPTEASKAREPYM